MHQKHNVLNAVARTPKKSGSESHRLQRASHDDYQIIEQPQEFQSYISI